MIAACDAGLTEALGRFSVSMKSSFFSFFPSIGVHVDAFGIISVSMMISDQGLRFRWTGAILHAVGWICVSPTISGAYDQYMAHDMMPPFMGRSRSAVMVLEALLMFSAIWDSENHGANVRASVFPSNRWLGEGIRELYSFPLC